MYMYIYVYIYELYVRYKCYYYFHYIDFQWPKKKEFIRIGHMTFMCAHIYLYCDGSSVFGCCWIYQSSCCHREYCFMIRNTVYANVHICIMQVYIAHRSLSFCYEFSSYMSIGIVIITIFTTYMSKKCIILCILGNGTHINNVYEHIKWKNPIESNLLRNILLRTCPPRLFAAPLFHYNYSTLYHYFIIIIIIILFIYISIFVYTYQYIYSYI